MSEARLNDYLQRAAQVVSMMPKWKQEVLGGKAVEVHISPNGAEPGSLAHAAEAWAIGQGFTIPDQRKYPHTFQGILDDFCESPAYDAWERA